MAARTFVDIDNLDHDQDLAVALGNLVIAWAKAETVMVGAFALVCGMSIDHAHFGYYRIPTFDARVKVIRALLAEWETKEHNPANIADAVANLSRLSKARNNWVHAVWSKDRVSNETVLFDFRAAAGKGRMKPVKAPDITNHLYAVRLRTKELAKLLP